MMVDKDDQQRVEPGKQTGRKWMVGLLITLGLIFMLVANLAFWAYFKLINTHGWVTAEGSLSKDPAIANLISQISDLNLIPQAEEGHLVLFSNRQVAVM